MIRRARHVAWVDAAFCGSGRMKTSFCCHEIRHRSCCLDKKHLELQCNTSDLESRARDGLRQFVLSEMSGRSCS